MKNLIKSILLPVSSAFVFLCGNAIADDARVRVLEGIVSAINKSVMDAPPHSVSVPRIEKVLEESSLRTFSVARAGEWSNDELNAAITAYHSALYMSHGDLSGKTLTTMEEMLKTLSARTAELEKPVQLLHKSYLQKREFEKARALAAQFSQVQTLEPIPKASAATSTPRAANSNRFVWRMMNVAARGQTTAEELQTTPAASDKVAISLIREITSIGDGVVVVAVVAPRCHFSARALNAIKKDAELAEIVKNATWLMPPAMSLDVAEVSEWNRANPTYRFDYVHAVREWPEIDYWDTPHFYFFADGKKVATVGGWPREGRKAEMLAAFESAKAALKAK